MSRGAFILLNTNLYIIGANLADPGPSKWVLCSLAVLWAGAHFLTKRPDDPA